MDECVAWPLPGLERPDSAGIRSGLTRSAASTATVAGSDVVGGTERAHTGDKRPRRLYGDRAALLEDPALDAGGRLLLVDMLPHEREEYRRTMGHRHLGFSLETVERWASCAGMQVSSFSRMPMPGDASGPPLFVAVLS